MNEKFTLPLLNIFLFLMMFSSCRDRDKKGAYTQLEQAKMDKELLSGIDRVKFEGTMDDKTLNLYVLKNKNGVEAAFSNYGQRLVSLMVPDKNGKIEDIVLGYSSLDKYQTNRPFFATFKAFIIKKSFDSSNASVFFLSVPLRICILAAGQTFSIDCFH